jgi:hypothetical protein
LHHRRAAQHVDMKLQSVADRRQERNGHHGDKTRERQERDDAELLTRAPGVPRLDGLIGAILSAPAEGMQWPLGNTTAQSCEFDSPLPGLSALPGTSVARSGLRPHH